MANELGFSMEGGEVAGKDAWQFRRMIEPRGSIKRLAASSSSRLRRNWMFSLHEGRMQVQERMSNQHVEIQVFNRCALGVLI